MTTGTKSYDNFQNHPNGYGFIGTKGSESWSGSDTPKSARSRTKRITIKTTRLVRKRDGTMKIVPYIFKVRDPSDQDPAQKRVPRPENPYTKSVRYLQSTRTFIHGPIGDYFARSDWCGSNWFFPPSNSPVALLTANDQNKLINKLWSRMKGSDFDAGAFLGESRQALSMIGDTAIRVAKSVWHIRRGDVPGALRTLVEGTSRAPLQQRKVSHLTRHPNLRSDAKAQADLFLEMQFGWLPLLKDVEAASEMLAHHLELPAQKVYRVMVESKSKTPFNNGGYEGIDFVIERFHTRHLKAIVSEADPPSMLEKLGLADPLLVAWNAAPFSFLADWILPVGQALEARAAASAIKGTFVTSDKRMTIIAPGKGVYWKFPPIVGGHERNIDFDRTISTNLVAVLPSFQPLNKVLSVVHVLDSIALMTQILTKPSASDGPQLQSALRRNRVIQLTL